MYIAVGPGDFFANLRKVMGNPVQIPKCAISGQQAKSRQQIQACEHILVPCMLSESLSG